MSGVKATLGGVARTACRSVRLGSGLLGAGTLMAGPARAEAAPDVVVLCDPSLRRVLVETGRAWQARSHVPVRVFVASLAQGAALARHGARADLLVGIGAGPMDAAQRLGAVRPPTRAILARDPLVLAVRGPKMQPMALASGSNLGPLLGGGRLGLADPALGQAGADARAALAAVGLWPALELRSVGAETTAALAALLSAGEVRVAVLYRSDVAARPGLSVAATFPGAAPPVEAALTADTLSPCAPEFLAYLRGDGLAALERAGLEPP